MSGDFDRRDCDSRERAEVFTIAKTSGLASGEGLAPPRLATIPLTTMPATVMAIGARNATVSRETETMTAEASIRAMCSCDLDLPRGPEREFVHDRDRDYTLNGSESRTLATVGAFRVVSDRDLQDPREEKLDLRHLEKQASSSASP